MRGGTLPDVKGVHISFQRDGTWRLVIRPASGKLYSETFDKLETALDLAPYLAAQVAQRVRDTTEPGLESYAGCGEVE